MLYFFGLKLGWLPIGKFLYPEKWYDAPYDSDVIFVSMIKFTAVVSVLQILVYIFTRNIESLNLRRNARFAGFIVLTIASLFYWNSGDLANQKFYAMDIAYHMILPVFTVTVVAFAGTALLTRTTMMEVLKVNVIPEKSIDKDMQLLFSFTDSTKTFSLFLRKGVLEIQPFMIPGSSVQVKSKEEDLKAILSGIKSLPVSLVNGTLEIEGSRADLLSFFSSLRN